MRGLELAQRFFLGAGVPLAASVSPELLGSLAAGLVGEGSECFGVDDEFSRDHDWGAGFCIWLPRELCDRYGVALADGLRCLEAPDGVPSRFAGMEGLNDGRVGVFAVEDFYWRFTGLARVPEGVREWWAIPEANLATATNGMVFCDRLGVFSRWREGLVAGCPRDVRLKRMAYCCYLAFQAGPYNRARLASRNLAAAAQIAETTFVTVALRIVYLLNDCYPPFYKWLQPLVRPLPVLGQESFAYAEALARIPFSPGGTQAERQKAQIVEGWCADLGRAITRQGLAEVLDGDLYEAARQIHAAIEDRWLRSIPLEVPC